MANVQDIDIEAIKVLLSINNIEIPDKKHEIYDKAFSLMNNESTSYEGVPTSIIEWMLAYNALKKSVIKKSYHIRDLRKLSKIDQNVLAKSLGMKGNNVDNIVNILRYMHKLEGELKFEENLDLYKPLLLNSDLFTVINLLESKQSLKPLVLEILPEILKNDYNINGDDYAYQFVAELLHIKDMDLIKRSIKVYGDLIKDFDPYHLFDSFFLSKQLELLFEMIPKNYNINVLIEGIDLMLESDLESEEYYYLIHESLKYAVRIKNKELFEHLEHIWDNVKNELTEEENAKIRSLFETKL